MFRSILPLVVCFAALIIVCPPTILLVHGQTLDKAPPAAEVKKKWAADGWEFSPGWKPARKTKPRSSNGAKVLPKRPRTTMSNRR